MYKPTLPSSLLSARDEKEFDFSKKVFGNTYLRLGVVLEALPISSERNISKLGPEYDVMAIEQEGGSGSNTTIYKNCISADSFGGMADYFQFTHRPSSNPKEAKRKGSLKDQKGAIVLLLCLDGNSEKALILKSIHNPSRSVVLTDDKEHHLEGEFNGLNWSVDRDGALKIEFKSATEADGTPMDEAAGGSLFKIEKDGSVEITDQPTIEGTDRGDMVDFEKIRLDKTEMTIEVESREDMSFTTDENVNIVAGSALDVSLGSNLIMAAEGSATIMSEEEMTYETQGPFRIGGQSVRVDSKSLIQISSQSLFQVEAGATAIINAPQLLLGSAPAQPALLGLQLLTIGTGNNGGPVVSSAVAGFSGSILLT